MNETKSYLYDINRILSLMVNLVHYEENDKTCKRKIDFWYMIFLISKSFLNENFHKLFNFINDDFIEKVFMESVSKSDFFDDTFLCDNSCIIDLFLNNQFFEIDSIHKRFPSNNFHLIVL